MVVVLRLLRREVRPVRRQRWLHLKGVGVGIAARVPVHDDLVRVLRGRDDLQVFAALEINRSL